MGNKQLDRLLREPMHLSTRASIQPARRRSAAYSARADEVATRPTFAEAQRLAHGWEPLRQCPYCCRVLRPVEARQFKRLGLGSAFLLLEDAHLALVPDANAKGEAHSKHLHAIAHNRNGACGSSGKRPGQCAISVQSFTRAD